MCFSLVESLNRISVEVVDVSRMKINTDCGNDKVVVGRIHCDIVVCELALMLLTFKECNDN